MELKELLDKRTTLKSKKPAFLKQDAHKLKRLKKNWRQPRGRHSKMRKKLRSYRRQPSMGFSSPKAVRNLTKEGHKLILVHNISDLDNLKEPITIAATVGNHKKIEMLKKAKEKKLKVLNVKDVDKFIKEAEEKLKARKELKKKKHSTKEKSKAERLKKAEEKEKKEQQKPEEQKTEEQVKQAKEEKRKVLEQ
jgi:large subunit ribosomal protein L32e